MLLVSLPFLLLPLLAVLTDDSSTVQFQTLTLSKKVYLRQTRCQAFKINANYRKLKLSFQSQNIDHLQITNKLINNCQQDLFSECDQTSNLCIQSHISSKAEFSIGKCMDHFYAYAYIKNFVGGSLSVKMSETSGCDSIPEDPYTVCASIPINQCGTKGTKNCNKDCRRIDCSFTNNINKNLTSLQTCLPANSSPSLWQQRCNEDYNFFRAYSKRLISNECGKDPTTDIYENERIGFLEFIGWVVFVVVMVVVGSSLFYRYRLRKTGVAPWNPPEWAPVVLYPRRDSLIGDGEGNGNYRQI